jgi:hypothetical protein
LPHAVQKSKNEKCQKDADDCVKQAFFSKDHVSKAPFESCLGGAAFLANCNSAPWLVPMINAVQIGFGAKTPFLANVKKKSSGSRYPQVY